MKAVFSIALATFALGSATGQSMKVDRNRIPATRSYITFKNGSHTLHGYIFKPYGKGPFPAILWNHGSEQYPADQPELAKFYNDNGFVFFIPHRQGQGHSPGDYIIDLQEKYAATKPSSSDFGKFVVKLQERQNKDVEAAMDWLKAQTYVDRKRLFMSGCSFGGMQTLLAAEKGLGLKGAIPFAPAAMSWHVKELRDRMLIAVIKARVPLFLIQAKNDYSTGPSKLFGPQIKIKGFPNRAKLYPNFGPANDPASGHGKFATKTAGIAIWGGDVMSFIRDALK